MKSSIVPVCVTIACILFLSAGHQSSAWALTFEIVDTGQINSFDASTTITSPALGDPFYGQDAQYDGNQPNFTLSGDGLTVQDNVSALVWMASPDTDQDGTLESPGDKISFWDALDFPATLNAQNFGGYDDWRLPSIKELYSLINFSGIDPSGYSGDTSGLIPFIDTNYFAFEYGDETAGERIIDSQYWSTNEYVSTTMGGDHTVFGVNFADGRIKGYPTSMFGSDKTNFVLCCRGNSDYGINDFIDNGDGTVTDVATGLMWQQGDSGSGLNWEDALAHAENLVLADHNDWRLPNAKELQGILDYTRSPATHGTAAIDPVFTCTMITDEGGSTNFPFFWSGTTHANWSATPGNSGVYVCFGEALGWMQAPFPPYDYTLMDVHGAGSQRSDQKAGDAADWPYGHGPQGDVVRIEHYVRCVRDAAIVSSAGDELPDNQTRLRMKAAPNPFNPSIEVSFSVPAAGTVNVSVFDTQGRLVAELMREYSTAGEHTVTWGGEDRNGNTAPSGVYLVLLTSANGETSQKITLAK